jgi:hypothetical protein
MRTDTPNSSTLPRGRPTRSIADENKLSTVASETGTLIRGSSLGILV